MNQTLSRQLTRLGGGLALALAFSSCVYDPYYYGGYYDPPSYYVGEASPPDGYWSRPPRHRGPGDEWRRQGPPGRRYGSREWSREQEDQERNWRRGRNPYLDDEDEADDAMADRHGEVTGPREPRSSTEPPAPPRLSDDVEPTPKTDASTTKVDPQDIKTATKAKTPGRVKSPYPPYSELDVSGLNPGSLAKDPVTGKVFRIP